MSEQEYAQKLRSARNVANQAKQVAMAAASPIAKAKLALSFGKKLSKHWPILVAAVVFDGIGMIIPYVGVVFNAFFGLILFMHFGPKKKPGESELLKIALPMILGSGADLALAGELPVNFGAALLRIILD